MVAIAMLRQGTENDSAIIKSKWGDSIISPFVEVVTTHNGQSQMRQNVNKGAKIGKSHTQTGQTPTLYHQSPSNNHTSLNVDLIKFNFIYAEISSIIN